MEVGFPRFPTDLSSAPLPDPPPPAGALFSWGRRRSSEKGSSFRVPRTPLWRRPRVATFPRFADGPGERRIVATLLVLLSLASPQRSDLKLEGPVLARFLKSKGRSLAGQSVHWHLPAKVFTREKSSRRGMLIFETQGIAIVVPARSPGLSDVRRRGKIACVRGRIRRIPKRGRRKGGPSYYIDVRSLRHRKK